MTRRNVTVDSTHELKVSHRFAAMMRLIGILGNASRADHPQASDDGSLGHRAR